MDSNTISQRITTLKARLFELAKEQEAVRDELMISLGKAQAYAEVEAKLKQELETQSKKE